MFADLAGRSAALCSAVAPSEFDSYSIDVMLPWNRYAIMNYCMAGGVCLVDEYLDVRGRRLPRCPLKTYASKLALSFVPAPLLLRGVSFRRLT